MKFSTKEKAVFLGFIISILFSFTSFSGKCEGIYDKILRFHIVANSDSSFDQKLKFKVRDKILEKISPDFKNINDLASAKKISDKNLKNIEDIAKQEILKNGCNYEVKAENKKMYFNTRKYKNVTIPAGYYDAVRLTIGEGKGRNFWCVMFPPMCLPIAEEHKVLSDVLTKDEIEMIENEKKYEIRFKCIELYFDCKNWFAGIF